MCVKPSFFESFFENNIAGVGRNDVFCSKKKSPFLTHQLGDFPGELFGDVFGALLGVHFWGRLGMYFRVLLSSRRPGQRSPNVAFPKEKPL